MCVVHNWLTARQIEDIKETLIRAIKVFCNNFESKKCFSAYDLIGKENKDWNGTPLEYIFRVHLAHNRDTAYVNAAKDVGLFLLDVLRNDKNCYKSSISFRVRNGKKIKIRQYSLN